MDFLSLKQKIETSNQSDFGQTFNDSFGLFKKTWQYGFLFLLSYFGFTLIITMIFASPLIMMGLFQDVLDVNNYKGLSLVAILVVVIIGILLFASILVVAMGLLGGLFLIYKKADFNESFSASDMFTFINLKSFSGLLKLALAQIGISIIAVLLCYFPIIYVSIPLHFLILFYIFNPELSTTEIIKLSFQIGNKNWIIAFALIFVLSFIAGFGLILCFVGYLFTFTLAIIPIYLIYKNAILNNSETEEINQIGTDSFEKEKF